ncbi:MAG: hypothetical protein HY722_17095 [Planctomycetes bacterium]|nr:hypothetical protein [Planctomycetota bacterium]
MRRQLLQSHLSVLLALVAILLPVSAVAQTASGQRIRFQGRITDDKGDPVAGTHHLVFKIYASPTATTAVWGEEVVVQLDLGVFSVVLGQTTGLDRQMVGSGLLSNVIGDPTQSVFDGTTRFIGFGVTGQAEIGRVEVVSSPFAMNAALLAGRSANEFVQASATTGAVGIGTSAPGARLTIHQGQGNTPADGLRLEAGTVTWNQFINTGGRLHIESSGGARVVVRDDGGVGIGVADPAARLHVQDADASMQFKAGAQGQPLLTLGTTTNRGAGIVFRTLGSDQITVRADDQRFDLLSGGFTDDPNQTTFFSAYKSGTLATRFITTSGNDQFSSIFSTPSSAVPLLLRAGGSATFFWMVPEGSAQDGAIGVRTLTPQATLHVAGNIKATGTIMERQDFAERVDVQGARTDYAAGDVLGVVEGGRFALSGGPRARNVAGVVSLDPGVLGTRGGPFGQWEPVSGTLEAAPWSAGPHEYLGIRTGLIRFLGLDRRATYPPGTHVSLAGQVYAVAVVSLTADGDTELVLDRPLHATTGDLRFGLDLRQQVPLAVVGIVPCKVTTEGGPIRPGDLLVTSGTPGHAMRDDDPRVGTVLGKSLGSLEDEGTGAVTGMIDVLVTLQ